jgi:predicted dehydrogenase
MSDSLSFGLIGAGGIAQSYLQVFRGLDAGHIAAVADVRREAAESAADALGCEAFGSWEELVERPELDAVLICTPPVTHPEIAMHFLVRGVPVLCEKPLAIDVATARELATASEANGTVLTMASKFRYVQDVLRAKSILASGILGDVILFENVFAARAEMLNRWNSDPAISGGGVLIDNGTHSVDIMRYFLGPIEEILAVEGRRVQNLAVEDTVQLFVRAANGARGTVDLSWSLDKERDAYIEIYGSNGTVRVGWKQSMYRPTTSPDWVVFGTGYDKIAAMRAQVENFCGAVRGRERLRITLEDAIASVEVIEQAYRSLADSAWTRVRDQGIDRRADTTTTTVREGAR